MTGFAGIDSDGLSGGLALFWHDSMYVEVKEVTERFIDVHIQASPGEQIWHATFVYGEPRTENRHRLWSALCALRASSSLPWIVAGDFNEALWQHEHLSSCPRPEGQMADFRDTLMKCELKDIGFRGVPFTYDNKRRGRANVKVRLDREVADDSWRDIFSEGTVVHLVSPCSDHTPLLLQLARETRDQVPPKCKQYEIFWEREHALPEIIATAWNEVGLKSELGEINVALEKVMQVLHKWGNRKFGNVTCELSRLRRKLEQLMRDNAPTQTIRETTDSMNELLYKEEMLWLQRSCILWLREGDRNTKFFHRKAVWHARKNRIKSLIDADGVVKESPSDMERMAKSYFQSMYTRDPTLNSAM
ncbi:hypothetical protein ACQ4PT_037786 [Festuca glaucescens]